MGSVGLLVRRSRTSGPFRVPPTPRRPKPRAESREPESRNLRRRAPGGTIEARSIAPSAEPMHHDPSVLDQLTPDPSEAGRLPSHELLVSADLADALGHLADAPPVGETIVELDVPLAPPLRAFLRERGRVSGGWLNRGWSLPVSDLEALAEVAADCGPQPARVYRHAGDGAGSRLWVLGGERREPPAHDRSGA